MSVKSDIVQFQSVEQLQIPDSSRVSELKKRVEFWQGTSELLTQIAAAPDEDVNKLIALNNWSFVHETLRNLNTDLRRTKTQEVLAWMSFRPHN